MRPALVEYGSPRNRVVFIRTSRAGLVVPPCQFRRGIRRHIVLGIPAVQRPGATGFLWRNWCCLRPRVPQLDGTTNEACRTSAGWCRESTPDARTTSCRVEPLGIDVLLEDPQEHAQRRPAFGDDPRRLLEQGGSDPIPLESGGHMQIVDEGTPEWISVERGVDETHELPVRFGHDGASIPARFCHSADPDLQTISDDVAVEVRRRNTHPGSDDASSQRGAGPLQQRRQQRQRGTAHAMCPSYRSSSILALAPCRKAGCRTVKGPGPSGHSG